MLEGVGWSEAKGRLAEDIKLKLNSVLVKFSARMSLKKIFLFVF